MIIYWIGENLICEDYKTSPYVILEVNDNEYIFPTFL